MMNSVDRWFVVFWPKNPTGSSIWQRDWWEDWWAIGGWRHVSAFGFCAKSQTWVFFDVNPSGIDIRVEPDGPEVDEFIGNCLSLCSVVQVDQMRSSRFMTRLGFNCVTATKHLIGARCGALTPWGLRTYLLRTCKEVSYDQSLDSSPPSGHPVDHRV